MPSLEHVSPWAFASIVAIGTFAIVALLIVKSVFKGRAVNLGIFKLGADGKPEKDERGRLIKREIAAAPEELERVADIIIGKMGHTCVRGPVIEAVVNGHGTLLEGQGVILRDLTDGMKRNGPLTVTREKTETHAEEWSEFLKSQAMKAGIV